MARGPGTPSTPSGAGFLDPRELSAAQLVVIGLGGLLAAAVLTGASGFAVLRLAALYASVVAAKWRPDGGGQTVALVRGLGAGGDRNPSLAVLAIELIALGCFAVALPGLAVPGLLGPRAAVGGAALLALAAAGLLWTLAWVLEGLSAAASNPWREGGRGDARTCT